MNTLQDLNAFGQAALAIVGNLIVNGAVHPICTMKNRHMAKESVLPGGLTNGVTACARALYKGYPAICITESVSYGISLLSQGWLQKHEVGPLLASVAAGIASAPAVTIGEGIVVQAQMQGTALQQAIPFSSILKGAMSLSGLLATTLREVPFTVAVFAAAPAIQQRVSLPNELANNTLAGLISGGIAGAITAPMDAVKTRIQAREASFGVISAEVFRELQTVAGRKEMLGSAAFRAIYIGLAVAILNVVNNQLPQLLPKSICSRSRNQDL